ncbi:MAG: ATP-binding cassette domain-containing protein [Weeksellaceae bacterium]
MKNINFEIQSGEFIAILGESGSGKSTLLKLIYGLEDVEKGEITFNNKQVTGPKFNLVPGHPEMKFVPQEFNLLEMLSAAENVGKYLSSFNLSKKQSTINRALRAVSMLSLKDKLTAELSGGERQRISIASALAARPKVLLLDEPYGHLDQILKNEIRTGIREWALENNCIVLLTTHDIQDVMGFSDRVFVIKNGRIIQKAVPEELKSQPKNEYVAGLLGEYSVLDANTMKSFFKIQIEDGRKAIIYPEELEENNSGTTFKIINTRFQGRDYLVKAEKSGQMILFYSAQKPEKDRIKLKIKNFRWV